MERFHLPPMVFLVPRPVDRACPPPAGFVTVFKTCLVAGLHFPLPPSFIELLQRVRLSLGQLIPNSFRQLVCMDVEAHRRKSPFSANFITKYFQFKHLSGAFYLSPRPGARVKAKTPSKVNNCQKKFFICRVGGMPEFGWRTEGIEDEKTEVEYDDAPLAELNPVVEPYSEE